VSLQSTSYETALASHRPLKRSGMRRTAKAMSPRKASLKRTSRKRGTKRKKVATRKSLIKKIDGLVFQIICLTFDACVECGSKDKPTTGHVLSRRSFATRWDFRNVFRQCWPCNYKAAMTAAASYHLWYVKKFGVEAFDVLYRDWAKGHKYSRLELEVVLSELLAKYTALNEANPLIRQ